MDSRTLNVFHEDSFEGNFVKYDPEPNFWTTNDDLQLTDTLNGILPIAPTDESLLSPNDAEEQLQNTKNLLVYSDFVEQHFTDDTNLLSNQVYRHITDSVAEAAFEQQQQQISLLIDSDNEQSDRRLEDDDVHSNSTFRTRTDSSSIGDYESRTSDYDDFDEGVLPSDGFALHQEEKERTLSSNTVCAEADALGLNIDVNNFDLADFITKDDFFTITNSSRSEHSKAMPAETISPNIQIGSVEPMKPPNIAAVKSAKALPNSVIISSKSRESDYDSDSIIDVETVDALDIEEGKQEVDEFNAIDDLCYVDNIKADPSWCPKQAKRINTTEHKQPSTHNQSVGKATHAVPAPPKLAAAVAPNSQATVSTTKPKASNICLVPNKKQCEFLKRKVNTKAAGAGTTNKLKASNKKMQESTKALPNGKQQALVRPTEAQSNNIGLGLGGKNLALLKHERDAAAAALNTERSTPAPKRKLNLEEYKQRRCGKNVGVNGIQPAAPAATTPVKQSKVESGKVVQPAGLQKAQQSPQKAAISNIVNSLKCPASQPQVATDPITVAKNKVLRMLEMKRAQQLKIIDSRVNAKVPRVTKLPPLKDIVKDTYCMENEPKAENSQAVEATINSKLHSDYEEIIIVSASCNTDITIPPHQAGVALRGNKITTPSSRSLLKSSVLLYNIFNGSETGKDMTNSLIASIQSEVVKQTNCDVLAAPAIAEKAASDKNGQHGEDMVIMHLPKNRVRKRMVSMGTQTALQAEFPLLTLPTARESRERTRRSYRKLHIDGSGSNDSSCSSASSSSIASYRSRSNSNSAERLRHSDATLACGSSIGGGGYSSRSTRRHRSSVSSSSNSEGGKFERQQRQRRTSYNKRRSKNHKRDACSSSGSEYSDRERSRSPYKRSRSRSISPTRYGSSNNNNNNNNRRGYIDRNVSRPAVEERRIVYVGRIEPETTKEMLRRKFLPYGNIKQITIHYKENGMKYGFVTYERAQDAFTAIDTSARDAQINMYDISFGGRRAFCRASYADLDNAGINNYHSYVFPKAAPATPPQEDSFEALLLKVKAKLNAGKPASATAPSTPEAATVLTENADSKVCESTNIPI